MKIIFAATLAAFSVAALAADTNPLVTRVVLAVGKVEIKVVGEYRVVLANGMPDHAPGEFPNAHNPNRLNRMLAFLHPEDHKDGFGYQAWQAKLAFGAGGWSGLGLGDGRQKLGFVPEHHTDFIYSVIGEELGLIACLLVLLAYLVLFYV